MDEYATDNIMYTDSLLLALPKTDLHCHLDGSMRLGTLIELAKDQGLDLPSMTPEGLRTKVFKPQYTDLMDYLRGFQYTVAVLRDVESIERVAYELGIDCLNEGVRYLEVRLAPQLHLTGDMTISDVLEAVTRGLSRVEGEHRQTAGVREEGEPPFRFGIICCAMRMFTDAFGPYFRDLRSVLSGWPEKKIFGIAALSLARGVVDARDRLGLPIVGFDLAGAEAGHPASDFVSAYQYAHRHFLKRTVHAGEAYGPESIYQAITRLNADRIGHGTHLYSTELVQEHDNPEGYVTQLAQYIGDSRTLLEVCLTSNLQTMPELTDVKDHPISRMIQDRLSVTLCTDNRLMSDTTVSEELKMLCAGVELAPAQLRNIVLHGFKRSFFPGTYLEKRKYVRKAIDYYDRVARQHGLPDVARGEDQ